jgi:hypothetical protein
VGSQAFSVGYDRVTLALEAVRQVERGMSFFVVIWGTGQGCRSQGRPRALPVGLPMWWWLPAPGLFWTENRIAGSEMGIGGRRDASTKWHHTLQGLGGPGTQAPTRDGTVSDELCGTGTRETGLRKNGAWLTWARWSLTDDDDDEEGNGAGG